MTITIMNSADEIAELTTGKLPARPEVEADNAKQRAAAGLPAKTEATKPEPTSEAAKPEEGEDIEGSDGLTARQKREWTEAMLKTVGKKHREKLEAEEFAADQYNRARLADQRADNLERQLAELRTAQQPLPKAAEVTKKPERSDFQDDQSYQDARVDFRVKETLAKDRQAEREREAAERDRQITETANARLAKAAELVPDFTETVESGEMRVPGHIAGYMRESELFAELGYHFAKHPEVLERVAKLSPAKALVEVGKIESTLKPFASRTAASSEGKVNGDKPSASETESASSRAATEEGADPSRETESAHPGADPSRTRAPVIKPLNTSSAAQVELNPKNTREHIEKWQRDRKVNLGLRRRH